MKERIKYEVLTKFADGGNGRILTWRDSEHGSEDAAQRQARRLLKSGEPVVIINKITVKRIAVLRS